MKRFCIKTLKIGNATFLPDSEYKVNFDPFREGNLFLTDDRGITVDIPIDKFRVYFI